MRTCAFVLLAAWALGAAPGPSRGAELKGIPAKDLKNELSEKKRAGENESPEELEKDKESGTTPGEKDDLDDLKRKLDAIEGRKDAKGEGEKPAAAGAASARASPRRRDRGGCAGPGGCGWCAKGR